jgi:hypothetical protein
MSTWLLDTPLFNMLATPKAKPLLEWRQLTSGISGQV